MNIWGERFAEVQLFRSYCRDLGVETDQHELEHYERIGGMLPVARVVYPDDYVIQRDQSQWGGASDWDGSAKWPAVARLAERVGPFPSGYEGLTDQELVHCFDREIEAGDNPHLRLPSLTDFRPWSDYVVRVDDKRGNTINRPTVKHYYSYWQIHQLYWIQLYPDLYKNARLIERIPEDDTIRRFRPWAPQRDRLLAFDGKRRSFDALSFWTTVYGRERGRTFAGIAEVNGVRKLNDTQAEDHRTRLATLAEEVTRRFQLSSEDLYSFLRELIKLLEEYKRTERYKLAEELTRDIFAWEDLLTLTTGETWDAVAEELGKTNIYDKRTFRHLNIAAKERDYAFDLLNSVSKECGIALQKLGDSQWSFAEADTNDLLKYCEQEGLGVFVTALSGMVAIGDEEHRWKFTRVQKYTNLKNVLTAYEYFLKTLAQGSSVVTDKKTLTKLVGDVMAHEPWCSSFDSRTHLVSGGDTRVFIANLGTLLTDKQLRGSPQRYWARQFLVMCLARNMTVHSYPSEDSYYGDLFGPMLDAAICATFYTWRFAKAHGWI